MYYVPGLVIATSLVSVSVWRGKTQFVESDAVYATGCVVYATAVEPYLGQPEDAISAALLVAAGAAILAHALNQKYHIYRGLLTGHAIHAVVYSAQKGQTVAAVIIAVCFAISHALVVWQKVQAKGK